MYFCIISMYIHTYYVTWLSYGMVHAYKRIVWDLRFPSWLQIGIWTSFGLKPPCHKMQMSFPQLSSLLFYEAHLKWVPSWYSHISLSLSLLYMYVCSIECQCQCQCRVRSGIIASIFVLFIRLILYLLKSFLCPPLVYCSTSSSSSLFLR